MFSDEHLKIEKVGKVWRATYDGVTICSTRTKSACRDNAEYLMKHMQRDTWQALVRKSQH